ARPPARRRRRARAALARDDQGRGADPHGRRPVGARGPLGSARLVRRIQEQAAGLSRARRADGAAGACGRAQREIRRGRQDPGARRVARALSPPLTESDYFRAPIRHIGMEAWRTIFSSLRGSTIRGPRRRAVAGLAPDPATTPEPVVQVYGARCQGLLGLLGMHTWIAVKRRGESRFTVYE